MKTITIDFADDTPEIVLNWLRQILAPDLSRLVSLHESGQVEIRLYANRGKVRKSPMILLNAGPTELVDTVQ